MAGLPERVEVEEREKVGGEGEVVEGVGAGAVVKGAGVEKGKGGGGKKKRGRK